LIHIVMDIFEIMISMIKHILYVIIIMLIYGIKIIRKMSIFLTDFTWNQRPLAVVRWQVVLQAVDLSQQQHSIALGPLVVQLLGHFQL
jgi:hypothetical protein